MPPFDLFAFVEAQFSDALGEAELTTLAASFTRLPRRPETTR